MSKKIFTKLLCLFVPSLIRGGLAYICGEKAYFRGKIKGPKIQQVVFPRKTGHCLNKKFLEHIKKDKKTKKRFRKVKENIEGQGKVKTQVKS